MGQAGIAAGLAGNDIGVAHMVPASAYPHDRPISGIEGGPGSPGLPQLNTPRVAPRSITLASVTPFTTPATRNSPARFSSG